MSEPVTPADVLARVEEVAATVAAVAADVQRIIAGMSVMSDNSRDAFADMDTSFDALGTAMLELQNNMQTPVVVNVGQPVPANDELAGWVEPDVDVSKYLPPSDKDV